jgi:hypothetical protein
VAGKGGAEPVRHAGLARCANEVGTKVPDQMVWPGTVVGDERLELPLINLTTLKTLSNF